MTNRERLNALPDKEFLEEINKIANSPSSAYIDWENWLSQEEPEPHINGERAMLLNFDGEKSSCIILEETTMFNHSYAKVITIDNEIRKVPSEYIIREV